MYTYAELDEAREKCATGEFRKGFGVFEGYTMPESFRHLQKAIDDFEVYDDDIWVTTFPKCGTTWCQEMIWAIFNDLDYESTKVESDIRMPFLELSCILFPPDCDFAKYDPGFIGNSVEIARNAKRPRILKTHLPFELLPKQIRTFERNPKIIHVYRNVKDTCVSFYHHQKLLEGYRGDFNLFWQLFIAGKIPYTPMVDNVLSYWKHRSRANFLFVRFEDMKSDLCEVIRRVCAFLNKSFSEPQIAHLAEFLSFEAMQNNPFVDKHRMIAFCKATGSCIHPEGRFIREGKAGGYKAFITPDIEDVFDAHLREKLIGTDLRL